MFIGINQAVEEGGVFAQGLTELAAGFAGPLMLFVSPHDRVLQLSSRSRLLVPVNGTAQSRRAAEIAFAVARGTGARVHALFVSQTDGRSRTRLREERVLKDIAELGERYGVAVSTRISPRAAASDAILREARHNYEMVVMGVSARAGEGLFFGNTVTAVLKDADIPALMLAS
jgi:nucleotide-binding universal stress UspA family protein